MIRQNPLSLRIPAGAATRLGKGTRVLPLSLRDLLHGFEDAGVILLLLRVESELVLEALLRTTRSANAVLGLCPAGALAGSRDRHPFFASVVAAAQSVDCNRPLMIVAPPLRLTRPKEPELDAEQVQLWIEAGYTHVPLDLSALDLEDPELAPRAISIAAGPLLEQELGIELLLSPGQEDEAGSLCASLKLLGLEVDLVGVLGGGGVGMAVVASEVDPVGVSWWEGEEEEDFRSGLRNAVGAGVRLVCLKSSLTKVLTEALPDEFGQATHPLAQLEQAIRAGALDALDLDRLELRLGESLDDLLRLLRLRQAAPKLSLQQLNAKGD